jgi:hypothetical protein
MSLKSSFAQYAIPVACGLLVNAALVYGLDAGLKEGARNAVDQAARQTPMFVVENATKNSINLVVR